MRRAAALAAIACAALSIGWSSAASADPYNVEICTPTAHASDGLFGPLQRGGPSTMTFVQGCQGPVQGVIYQASDGGEVARGVGEYWELKAPEGTLIDSIEFDRLFGDTGVTALQWQLKNDSEQPLDSVSDEMPLPAKSHKVYPVNSAAVRGFLICPPLAGLQPCANQPSNPLFEVELTNLRAVLDDQVPPSVSKPVPASNPAHGTIDVSVSAADGGSGVDEVTLFVDGVKLAGHHDANEGKCQPPYGFVTPCRTHVTTSFPLDTTKLAEGPHELIATASDASGQLNGSSATTFTVQNVPTPTDTRAPLLKGVSLSRKHLVFAKAKKGGGTSLRFSTDEGGELKIFLEKPGTKGKKRKRVSLFTAPVTAGRGVIPLGAKLSSKHLASGGYRVSVTVEDAAGNVSAPASVPLKITRR